MNAKLRTALLGVWVATAAIGAVSLAIANIYFVGMTTAAYFPGDPPAADLLVEVSFLIVPYTVAAALVAAFAAKRDRKSVALRAVGMVAILTVAGAVIGSSPSGGQLLKRHLGEWVELKQLLRDNERRVREITGTSGGALSEAEVEKVRAWFKENPVPFKFQGLSEPVQVKLLTNAAPYVGVDFGKGQNAVFDLTTMRCTYSD